MIRPRKKHEPREFEFDDVLTAIADENMPAIQAAAWGLGAKLGHYFPCYLLVLLDS